MYTKKIWKKFFRQKNKLLLFLLLTVIQCKQRCTRTSLPCNVHYCAGLDIGSE
jgi:hypothetical protein